MKDRAQWKLDNSTQRNRLVIGCNYHTTWQSNRAMRFILVEIKGDKVRLQTRNTNKNFWTNASDLIFIETDYNIQKANDLENPELLEQ